MCLCAQNIRFYSWSALPAAVLYYDSMILDVLGVFAKLQHRVVLAVALCVCVFVCVCVCVFVYVIVCAQN